MGRYPESFTDLQSTFKISSDLLLKFPTLGATALSEGKRRILHGMNVNTYCTHETSALPMTDHTTNERELQAVREDLGIWKNRG